MGLKITDEEGKTNLSPQEKECLKIKTISTYGELDEHEQLNIEKAVEWTIHTKFSRDRILTEVFLKTLHKRMFSDVWTWAGKFRHTEKYNGVPWVKIPIELRYLLDNTKHWISHQVYPPDEIAIRFKHQLVKIHCFPNGNGRHSRLMADIIRDSIFKRDVFSWSGSKSLKAGSIRSNYIRALHKADQGQIEPLIDFANS